MGKRDKYLPLRRYLEVKNTPYIQLSYSDIEKILGFSLPESAHQYQAWCSNNYDHSQAIAWMDAGYETDFVSDSYMDKYITFIKVNEGAKSG